MATFRIEKTRDYTVMSNHHLKNRGLSLKAKGLLSLMLSLPEDWDYTIKGLASISLEGIDAIRQTLGELEKHGYVVRHRVRDERGCLKGSDYVIYEQPQTQETPLPYGSTMQSQTEEQPTPKDPKPDAPILEAPALENPALENPMLENPTLENPALGNPTQLNTKGFNTYPIKEKAGANPNPSNPHPSYPPLGTVQAAGRTRQDGIGMRPDAKGCAAADLHRAAIHQRIAYDLLAQDAYIDKSRLDEIVAIMTETLCATGGTMSIAGNTYPTALVQERFRQLNSQHIQYVFHCLDKNTGRIRNIKKYLLAVLFNAPSTMDAYYAALANQQHGGFDLGDLGDLTDLAAFGCL